MMSVYIIGLSVLSVCLGEAQFKIPNVKLEAFEPRGFRASIPVVPGIKVFAFHGNLNLEIEKFDPGDYDGDFTKPENNVWVYFNKNLQLTVGDVIYYWIYVQHRNQHYTLDKQSWSVTELIPTVPLNCEKSATTSNDFGSICKNEVIFKDNFENLNTTNWMVESYIPKAGPNYEFNSYENSPEVIKIRDHKLCITPQPKTEMKELKGVLDLEKDCTSPFQQECYHKHSLVYLLPPVKSGKLRSKLSFKYGRVDIRAKLPSGDWIFPEISLVPRNMSKRDVKLWIVYARGNRFLVQNDGEDVGANVIFGGPVLTPNEPKRSFEAHSHRSEKPYCDDMHTYTVIWKPGQISVLVDNIEYGSFFTAYGSNNNGKMDVPFETEYSISLGVGVGGINDFPDGCKSGPKKDVEKPWVNRDRRQIKSFFEARNLWMPTWQDNKASLEIEYVTVTAV